MLKRIFKKKKCKAEGRSLCAEEYEKHTKVVCGSSIHPMLHVDIFEKILPYIEMKDLLSLRRVSRSFRETVDSSKVFVDHVRSSCWAHLDEKNIKSFCKKSSNLPWTHFRFLDIKHKSFYESKEFRKILGKVRTEGFCMEIKVTATDKRDKMLKRSVQAKVEEICGKEGIRVKWVGNQKRPEDGRFSGGTGGSSQVIPHYYPNPLNDEMSLFPYYMHQHVMHEGIHF